MDRPDAAAVRDWTLTNDGDSFDWARYGYPPPAEGNEDRLERIVSRAVGYVEQTTGRQLDATLPPELSDLAEDAVLMRTAQILVGRGDARALRNAVSRMDLISMRAGDYSETRAGAQRSGPGYAIQVNPWRELSDVLLLLATPERHAALIAEWSGEVAPAAVALETRGYADFCEHAG